jgi:hypothetical protein
MFIAGPILRAPKESEMALSKQVKDSVQEAAASLRNALAFAARGEHPIIIQGLAEILMKLDALETIDEFMAKMGDHKMYGPF